ncbi:hypothetical protein HZQ94_08945 [Elizabethkingia anophelis]|nr:hypothetical protein [Elizabethkingia anophelis]MCT3680151.1 hypothetical protein [Elizabethkingia anophelis]
METPKQQAIKAAYGEYWAGLSNEQQKYALENEGWIKVTPSQYQMDMFSRLKLNKNTHSVRPKCLTGIRNNNSWTRIEGEEDLPKDKTIDVIINDECYQGYIYEGQGGLFCCVENRYNSTEIAEIIEASSVTHYQPIETPKPPIF